MSNYEVGASSEQVIERARTYVPESSETETERP